MRVLRAAVTALLVADLLLVVACVGTAWTTPRRTRPTFSASARDRALIELPVDIEAAQKTGVARFSFDGVTYVVRGLPPDYIRYSSSWARMP